MFKIFYIFLKNIKNKIRQYFYLRNYRKDTPEDTWKFYNKMKYFYRSEFAKRLNFSKNLNNIELVDLLKKEGFVKIKLNDVSKKKEFNNAISKFRNRYDEINKNYKENIHKKNYLIQYNFEFNEDIKDLVDPFVDIATNYLGTLPILDSLQMWYSPNSSEELTGSRLLHRDPEDFKQIKIFIPIEEIGEENR